MKYVVSCFMVCLAITVFATDANAVVCARGVQGRSEAAVDCLRKALVVSPHYVDAMFNLALLLQRTGAYAEAADYWRQCFSFIGMGDAGPAVTEILRDPSLTPWPLALIRKRIRTKPRDSPGER
jgi:hypothetical protein